MITIANPIYDVVFKYLMEDERIARTILSALLRKEITHVEMRPHEYVDEKIDNIKFSASTSAPPFAKRAASGSSSSNCRRRGCPRSCYASASTWLVSIATRKTWCWAREKSMLCPW